MPSRVNEQVPRSVMFLCLGTAFVLSMGQWIGSAGWLPSRSSIAADFTQVKRQLSKAQSVEPIRRSPAPAPATAKTDSRLVVDLSDRRVYLYKSSQLQASYLLAVAQAGWETPTGKFQVLNMEQQPTWIHPITGVSVSPGPDNPLGVAWIGFWTDGDTEIGFHGTNQEELIGEAVSHGCLRMRNQDIKAMYAQVSQGTLVEVRE